MVGSGMAQWEKNKMKEEGGLGSAGLWPRLWDFPCIFACGVHTCVFNYVRHTHVCMWFGGLKHQVSLSTILHYSY